MKSLISTDHCTVNASMFQTHYDSCCYFAFEENSFCFAEYLLLLLPSFARTVQVQVANQFFMICRTAACVLTISKSGNDY
jgi:hypothetical protein